MLNRMTIKNFQSISNLTYDFSPGLNIIIAENNTGKSVLFKVIEVLVNGHRFNQSTRRQFIRFGCGKSDVYVESDDMIYWAEITPKITNFYSGKAYNSFVFEGNQLPDGLRNVLGLLICEDGLIGNVIDDNQAKFLINSDAKVNNSILGLLTKDSNAEKVIEVTTERIKSLNSDIREKSMERSFITKELNTIQVVDISNREERLSDVNVLLTVSDILISIYDSLSGIQLEAIPNEDCKVLLDVVSSLNNISKDLSGVKHISCPKIDPSIFSFLKGLQDISNRVSDVKDTKLPDSNEIKALEFISKFTPNVNRILKLHRENKVLNIECARIKNQLDRLEGEVYDCPIHGTIKFVNGKECVPYNY